MRKLKIDIRSQMLLTADSFRGQKFNTSVFVKQFKRRFPEEWQAVIDAYGKGGKGSGQPHSSNAFIGRQLFELSEDKEIEYADKEKSPHGWGSPVISVWRKEFIIATRNINLDESVLGGDRFEGARKSVFVNKYERDPIARRNCILAHGLECAACDMNFELVYGKLGVGFIHVHHLKPLSQIGKRYKVDPVEDLIPVCPNCHAMIHRSNTPLTVAQVRSLRRQRPKI